MELSKLSRGSSRMSTAQTPKRYSGRVEKPKSNHPSPRGLERRRTVSAVKQYATLDDHYRTMFGLDADGNQLEEQSSDITTRPVSWHPSTAQYQGSSSSLRTTSPLAQQTLAPAATQFNTSNQIEPFNYQQHPRMDSLPSYQHALHVDNTWSSYMHGQIPVASDPPSYSSLPYQHATWFTVDQVHQGDSAPQYQQPEPQSNFLPIQQQTPSEQEQREFEPRQHLVRKKSTELIGLGLYDPPESSPPPFLTSFGNISKGLKLEETWQPPEEMEDDDEESSDEEEELPKVEEQQWSHMSHPIVNSNLSGQSFFFEDEVANEASDWWEHQSKQPTAVPRDGAIGYGWF
jgi:hypothetical protein